MTLSRFALALSLLTFGCGTAPAPSDTAARGRGDQPSENDIRNFHTVNADLYRSGSLRVSDVDEIDEMGIKTILSLEADGDRSNAIRDERAAALRQGLDFTRVPMNGSAKPTIDQINQALDVIARADQPVLVHCLHGADRTGIVIAAYRIRHDGWSVTRAIDELRSLGHARNLYWWDDVLYQVR